MQGLPTRDEVAAIGFDFYTSFGAEFECFNADYDRQDMASLITRSADVICEEEHYNHNTRTWWKIVTDASIGDGEDSYGDYECENCNVSPECDHDCAYHCTPSYNCTDCECGGDSSAEDYIPCDDDCQAHNDEPQYECEDCSQDPNCDEDCSYHCRRNVEQSGMEIVTPPLRGYNGVVSMYKVLDVVNDAETFVERDCGLHIHIDADSFCLGDFKRLARLYVYYESVIDTFMPTSRRLDNNHYCHTMIHRSWSGGGVEKTLAMIDECDDVVQIARIWNDRFQKLNFEAYPQHGTVEFRQHAGTTSFEKTIQWVSLCQAMCNSALAGCEFTYVSDEPTFQEFAEFLLLTPAQVEYWQGRHDQFEEDARREREAHARAVEAEMARVYRLQRERAVQCMESLVFFADEQEDYLASTPFHFDPNIWPYQIAPQHNLPPAVHAAIERDREGRHAPGMGGAEWIARIIEAAHARRNVA